MNINIISTVSCHLLNELERQLQTWSIHQEDSIVSGTEGLQDPF